MPTDFFKAKILTDDNWSYDITLSKDNIAQAAIEVQVNIRKHFSGKARIISISEVEE